MPPRILSEAELARFERWPAHVPSAELVRSFTLTGPDCDLIAVRRRPANRLGIAMQLCALRYLGFVPEDLKFRPPDCRIGKPSPLPNRSHCEAPESFMRSIYSTKSTLWPKWWAFLTIRRKT